MSLISISCCQYITPALLVISRMFLKLSCAMTWRNANYIKFFSHFFPLKNIIFLHLTDAKFHLFLFRLVWKQALRIRLTLPYRCTGFIKSLFWANEQRPVEHYLALGNLSLGVPSCFKIKAMQIFASFFLLMWTYFIKACKLFNYTLWI